MKYANRFERDINIDLPDGKKIHGILRGELDNSKPFIVMMHGRPGNGNELLQFLGSPAQLDAAVTWDASRGGFWQNETREGKDDFPEKACDDLAIGVGGLGYISTRRIEQYDIDMGDTTNWAAKKGYPIKFITADKGVYVDMTKQYYEVADFTEKLRNYQKCSPPIRRFRRSNRADFRRNGRLVCEISVA